MASYCTSLLVSTPSARLCHMDSSRWRFAPKLGDEHGTCRRWSGRRPVEAYRLPMPIVREYWIKNSWCWHDDPYISFENSLRINQNLKTYFLGLRNYDVLLVLRASIHFLRRKWDRRNPFSERTSVVKDILRHCVSTDADSIAACVFLLKGVQIACVSRT